MNQAPELAALPYPTTSASAECTNGHKLEMELSGKSYRPASAGETPLAPFPSPCPTDGCDLDAVVRPKKPLVRLA